MGKPAQEKVNVCVGDLIGLREVPSCETGEKMKLGLVLEINDFSFPPTCSQDLYENWAEDLGQRALIYWSDTTTSVHPSTCLEIFKIAKEIS